MAEIFGVAKEARVSPPLPGILAEDSRRDPGGKPLLAEGCYFLAYGNELDIWYEGTMRVQSRAGQLVASGDLYTVDNSSANDPQPIGRVPPRAPGIPSFPIANYTYYLRITKIEPTTTGFALTFEAHRYYPKNDRKLDGVVPPSWVLEGAFTAQMAPADAPPGYPAPERFFVGDIPTNPDDPLQRAQMQMGWVSPHLRKAVIEIDRVPDSPVPQGNGGGATWQSVFHSFGWEVNVIVSDNNITKSDGPVWTSVHADAAMKAHRDRSDLDAEWRYYLLVAEQIKAPGDAFGFMYHPKREALFMTSQHVFPEHEVHWGMLRGKRFDTTVAFFRTAVHEMGHAMGLGHNESGFHFMRPTTSIAKEATGHSPFPMNISWTFDPDDEQQLRHGPDNTVRPGGVNGIGGGGLPLPEPLPKRKQNRSAME